MIPKRFSVTHRWFLEGSGEPSSDDGRKAVLNGSHLTIDWATEDLDDDECHVAKMRRSEVDRFRGHLIEARSGKTIGEVKARMYKSSVGLLLIGTWVEDGDEWTWIAELRPEAASQKRQHSKQRRP